MKCHYCGKTFTSEAWYGKHSCRNKKSAEKIGEDNLLKVYDLFNFWFRYNGIKRKNDGKSLEGFLKSPYLPYFVDLAVMFQNIYIADTHDYILWVSDNQIPAKSWTDESVLTKYKKVQSKRGSAMERAIKSLELMTLYCDQKGIDVSDYFAVIQKAEALRWIESGRLSPWVFLNTSRASDLFDRMNSSDLQRVADMVDIEYWDIRFKQKADDVEDIKELMSDIGFEV